MCQFESGMGKPVKRKKEKSLYGNPDPSIMAIVSTLLWFGLLMLGRRIGEIFSPKREKK